MERNLEIPSYTALLKGGPSGLRHQAEDTRTQPIWQAGNSGLTELVTFIDYNTWR